jgi:hypothetical protein
MLVTLMPSLEPKLSVSADMTLGGPPKPSRTGLILNDLGVPLQNEDE